MFDFSNLLLWLLGIVVVIALVYGLKRRLSPRAIEARRRARSHAPVVSRRRGPSVKLAVNIDEPKKKKN